MKTCKLCNHAIESWQSCQIEGNGFAHTACLLGETPRPKPVVRLKPNEHVTFTADETHHRHSIDSEEETS